MKKVFLLSFAITIALQVNAQWLDPVHLDDLNNWTSTAGLFEWYAHRNNTPNNQNYGNGIQFLLKHDPRHGAQLVIPTLEQNIYFRRYTAGWSNWDKVWHTGNMNRSDVDFTANRITTKELSINSDESSGGWGITHLYWKGHSLILGSPKGSFSHNAVVFRPGGSNTAGQVCQNFFSLQKAINVDNYETCIQFATDGSINYIKYGNVLIGKATQTNTTYKLDVEGKIRAHEIIVNTTGADFVFEPTYKLRPLSELETFIKEHKHLPEIAPAKEMQENGVSAGEMQTKLLQKVEELTLYVIELKKRNSEQSRKIEDLQKENEQTNKEKVKMLCDQQAALDQMRQEIEKLKSKIQ